MNNVKILIVGAGNVGKAQISEAILKHGLDENSVKVVNASELNDTDVLELVNLNTIEVKQRMNVETLLAPQLIEACSDFRNYEKQNSQQGWKSRPKHKR